VQKQQETQRNKHPLVQKGNLVLPFSLAKYSYKETIMIRSTTITKIPAGKYRPMFNPELKEVFDKRDAILEKYQVSQDLNSYQVVKEADGSQTVTKVTYYQTVEDFNNCMKELQAFARNDRYHPDGTKIENMGEHSGLTRKYKLVNTQTNETIVDWTDIIV